MTTSKPPRAPAGLKARGRALWREILGRYALDPGEMQLLRLLCETVDRIDALDAELDGQPLTVIGGRGQVPKSNPLLHELREERRLVSRLVAELALPLPGEVVGRRRSPHQKSAAGTRWRRAARLRPADG
jgi:hypothetical protein